jgi:retinol dehydrogenase 12
MDYLIYLLNFIIGLLALGLYKKTHNGICKSKKRLDGKTCLITGGTSGIGLQIAVDFAMRGARVIVACPNFVEGNNAALRIIKESGNQNVIFRTLDLASLDSVRQFVKEFLQTEERLDILMNNAGVGTPQLMTDDGMHLIMQVNYFGHALLTILLLPLLKKTGTATSPSRIVNTSSILHKIASPNVDNLNPNDYNLVKRIMLYGDSKLCFIVFARQLAKKLKGSNVVINDADPGETGQTRIFLSFDYVIGLILNVVLAILSKSAWEGAQTPIFAAVDEQAGVESSVYYRDCERYETSKLSRDEDFATAIWKNSIKLIQLTDEEISSLDS